VSDATPTPAALKRIGHKGADLIAPGNTLESFDAALRAGVDMVEFDVLPESLDGGARLLLAHDLHDIGARTPLTLDEGLAHFSQDAWTGVDLIVDLKLPGYEERVVAAIRERGAEERVLVSTMETASLDRLRVVAPDVRIGWSVPRIRKNPFESRLTAAPAYVGMHLLRQVLPRRAAQALREGRCDAVMANHHLVTEGLVRAVLDNGGELYVWTVDLGDRIAAFERLGVTGVITNDPRLFAAPAVT
jgi:glycerophosphoryl diester phosphodiesterase